MKPIRIKLQNDVLQIGIDREPIVCWQYDKSDGSEKQKACRIFLEENSAVIYDSEVMETGLQNQHRIPVQLKSHQNYTIYIEAVNQYGETEKSDAFCFTSGITDPADWKGKWVSNGTVDPFYAGKRIALEDKPCQALISCAGVGQYVLKINGRLADDSVLNGSWTDFDKRIHYRTFDIANLLMEGQNDFRIEVGNGWYHVPENDERHFYTSGKGYKAFGNVLAAIATITLRFPDGRTEQFGTDGSWMVKRSETVYTNVYGSEDYDARLEALDWEADAIELPAAECPKGKLESVCYPPVKVKSVYAGKKIKTLADGSFLYDLGQNMSGLFEIKAKGVRGTKIRIIPVEKLDANGNPWMTVESWCCYTFKGEGIERWKPKFSYGAGRYIQIAAESAGHECNRPDILEVSGYFVTSSARDTGTFYCSDYRYMQIHDLVLHAVESNLNHVHTDCPTIEKLGWQEPNHLMGPSIFYTKDAACLWDKISADQRDSQYGDDEYDTDKGSFPHEYMAGLLPSIAPRYARFLEDAGQGSFWDIVPWGSSILMAAYEEYRFTGSRYTLCDNYETAKKYVQYLYKKYLDYPKIYKKTKGLHFLRHGLGDWGIEQNRGESRENIETAYLYKDLVILAETAGWLGYAEDQHRFESIAQEVCESYNHELLVWNPQTGEWAYDSYDKTGVSPTQATQAIPLQFDMVPPEKKESVLRSFLLTCGEGIMHTGEIGLPYILRTLGEAGRADIVQKMIFQKYHPSYYRFLEQGETTLPEFWRDDARSRNHDMMGAILEWLYRYMAGISSEDGFRHIKIAPGLPEGVKAIKCSYESVMGEIDVAVRCEDKMILEVQLPVNTEGEVWLAGKCQKISGGKRYYFERKQEDV